MDSLMEYTTQNQDLEFIVSLDYNLEAFSDYECLEWGELYETLGIYGHDPLILNGDTDFDSDGYYDHHLWNMFAGITYSSYAIIDHNMVVRYLFDSPNYNDFRNVYLPNLIDEMYGCTDIDAINYSHNVVYEDNSCIYGGDFNQDESIDINDVLILINMIIDIEIEANGDLNADGNTDILDIISLINLILFN